MHCKGWVIILKEIQLKLDRILPNVQKPGRYIGGELNSIVKKAEEISVRFAFCFPDTYEVGMSHLGMKILYSLLNSIEDVWCERVFAPWMDMEEAMRREGIPLYALESLDTVQDFDIIGFTLQYELSFTNILNMLDLLAHDRSLRLSEKSPRPVFPGTALPRIFPAYHILGQSLPFGLPVVPVYLLNPLPLEFLL